MTPHYCLAAYSVRACNDCAHNPSNQVGLPKGPELQARPRRDGRCLQWKAAKPEHRRRR